MKETVASTPMRHLDAAQTSFFMKRLGFPETALEIQLVSLVLLTVTQIEFVCNIKEKKRDEESGN